MRLQLFQAEGDTLLVLVEVKHNDVDLLVEFQDFAWVRDTAPADIGDVQQTVDATQGRGRHRSR